MTAGLLKSPQVSRTLFSILADLNNAVIWMVSTWPLISKSSNSFTKPLGIVPSGPVIIGITISFIFHSLFSSLARSMYLSLFLLSVIFYSVVHWDAEVTCSVGFLFFFFLFLTISRSDRLSEIKG